MRRSGEEVGRALARIEQRLDEMTARLDEMTAQLDWLGREIGPARRILRAIAAEDAGNRRRLAETRAQPAYQLPFTNAEPLVSVVIPTHDRAELLRSRSVKSALSQTHRNIEVIVVGDDSPPEVEAAVRSHEDPRVSYHRLPTPYRASSDARAQWLVRSVMARTEGLRRARGDWLLAFDDDDEMRPDQVQRLLELARDRQAEVAYGIAARHWNDGNGDRVGASRRNSASSRGRARSTTRGWASSSASWSRQSSTFPLTGSCARRCCARGCGSRCSTMSCATSFPPTRCTPSASGNWTRRFSQADGARAQLTRSKPRSG